MSPSRLRSSPVASRLRSACILSGACDINVTVFLEACGLAPCQLSRVVSSYGKIWRTYSPPQFGGQLAKAALSCGLATRQLSRVVSPIGHLFLFGPRSGSGQLSWTVFCFGSLGCYRCFGFSIACDLVRYVLSSAHVTAFCGLANLPVIPPSVYEFRCGVFCWVLCSFLWNVSHHACFNNFFA